ncbi:MAG TPA: LytTR family DNA-binding domain-containing protein [Tenuifilaceae bacterium]|nr:LytTR family DNA-binding domain-containing protein [Tenuifilaceae bacterium]
MINAIIIDDEAHARQTIRAILKSSCDDVNIVAEAANVAEAVNGIKQFQPQLLFLDINLPDGNGFDILKQVDHKNLRIIFITAYQEYAIQAIKFSAFDYILKPINPKELIETVRKAIDEENTFGYEERFQTFFNNINQATPEKKKIVLKTADKIHVVDIKNIVRCESDNAYTTIVVNTGKSIVVSKSIKSFDEMLSSQGFMRVHQSHLINTNYISYYNKHEGGFLVMSDNSNVPISNQKKPLLIEYLESL